MGEPGSGKSVALRHLGNQLAQRGKKSRAAEEKIPLYVNLRELRPPPGSIPNAKLIRDFVFDSISARNGVDASTYLRVNWDDHCESGSWFFLLDSFDEIAEVLHAPTGSSVIRDYAEAIRQFLNEVGASRGLLASREFKGPDSLSWETFRILPLNEKKQDQLIDNTFLEPQEKDVVRRHLAESGTSMGKNPLFLSLLCRYIGDLKRAPENDYMLLSSHIDRLASLDPDYMLRRYNLTPQKLMDGADRLAVAFAANSNLGLTPTQDDIAVALDVDSFARDDLENLLGALVYVKIGRSDVEEARAGDRRFAFSHRRYQETLFVKHLARNPGYISPRELISDLRWREYAATLLQTQDAVVIQPLIGEAITILEERAALQKPISIVPEFGGDLGYYDWDNEPAVPLLALLQEGLAHRLTEVSKELSDACAAFLEPRWADGDMHDRTMVVKCGGLLPQPDFANYLTFAFERGTKRMQALAFRQSAFVTSMPESLAEKFRRKLANQFLSATKRGERLRLEALAGRLPEEVGANVVLRRCTFLKRATYPFYLLGSLLFAVPAIVILSLKERQFFRISLRDILTYYSALPGVCMLFYAAALPFWFAFSKQRAANSWWPLVTAAKESVPLGLACSIILIFALISMIMISAPCRIGPSYIVQRLGGFVTGGSFVGAAPMIFIPLAVMAVIYLVVQFERRIFMFFGYQNFSLMAILVISFSILISGATMISLLSEYINKRRWRKKLRSLAGADVFGSALLLRSSSAKETAEWLQYDEDLLQRDIGAIRSISRVSIAATDGRVLNQTIASAFQESDPRSLDKINRLLEDRLNDALPA